MSETDSSKPLLQPPLFRGVPEKVLTLTETKRQKREKRNGEQRIRRAQKSHR